MVFASNDPKNNVTAVAFNFPAAYHQMGHLYTSHTLQAKGYGLRIQNSGLSYVTPFKNTTPSVESQAVAIFKQPGSGALVAPKRAIKP